MLLGAVRRATLLLALCKSWPAPSLCCARQRLIWPPQVARSMSASDKRGKRSFRALRAVRASCAKLGFSRHSNKYLT